MLNKFVQLRQNRIYVTLGGRKKSPTEKKTNGKKVQRKKRPTEKRSNGKKVQRKKGPTEKKSNGKKVQRKKSPTEKKSKVWTPVIVNIKLSLSVKPY